MRRKDDTVETIMDRIGFHPGWKSDKLDFVRKARRPVGSGVVHVQFRYSDALGTYTPNCCKHLLFNGGAQWVLAGDELDDYDYVSIGEAAALLTEHFDKERR